MNKLKYIDSDTTKNLKYKCEEKKKAQVLG